MLEQLVSNKLFDDPMVLGKEETYLFLKNASRDGYDQTTGTTITKILQPVSRFKPVGDTTWLRDTVLEKLVAFFKEK